MHTKWTTIQQQSGANCSIIFKNMHIHPKWNLNNSIPFCLSPQTNNNNNNNKPSPNRWISHTLIFRDANMMSNIHEVKLSSNNVRTYQSTSLLGYSLLIKSPTIRLPFQALQNNYLTNFMIILIYIYIYISQATSY